MLRDEIIEMARQAGLLPLLDEDCFQTMGIKNWGRTVKVLESFAKLVADREREHCGARAAIALLGTLKTTSDRVLMAIMKRG